MLNVSILNKTTWIAIIKFRGHLASKVCTIYSNGGHIGFNYTSYILNILKTKAIILPIVMFPCRIYS